LNALKTWNWIKFNRNMHARTLATPSATVSGFRWGIHRRESGGASPKTGGDGDRVCDRASGNGDCFAYAHGKSARAKLLFKGEGF
jgi:hypothetical protein